MVFWVYFVLNNLRESLRPALEKVGKGFAATGLSPNFWTVVGLVIALASAVVYGMGMEFGLIIGGILLLVSGFFDMVDGQVARVTGKTSKKGEYLDSMFDKISEVAIFLAANISSKGKCCAFKLSAGVIGAESVPSLFVLPSALVDVANA